MRFRFGGLLESQRSSRAIWTQYSIPSSRLPAWVEGTPHTSRPLCDSDSEEYWSQVYNLLGSHSSFSATDSNIPPNPNCVVLTRVWSGFYVCWKLRGGNAVSSSIIQMLSHVWTAKLFLKIFTYITQILLKFYTIYLEFIKNILKLFLRFLEIICWKYGIWQNLREVSGKIEGSVKKKI